MSRGRYDETFAGEDDGSLAANEIGVMLRFVFTAQVAERLHQNRWQFGCQRNWGDVTLSITAKVAKRLHQNRWQFGCQRNWSYVTLCFYSAGFFINGLRRNTGIIRVKIVHQYDSGINARKSDFVVC